jgi:3-(3-hydroxy-phenyl)propionate hydroxylase
MRWWRSDLARRACLLAGDAAHMQPPFLGQGMCQGVRDVANLSVETGRGAEGRGAGQAAEALLDSYGHERKAHVRELTSRLKHLGAIICERDPPRRVRATRLLADCGGTVKDTPRQDVLPRWRPACWPRATPAAAARCSRSRGWSKVS